MNIYVGNIAWGVSEDELEALFAQYGEVNSARIITDRESGRSKGFGFVEMATADSANAAIEALNDGVRAVVILDGRTSNACLLELFTDHGAGTLIKH